MNRNLTQLQIIAILITFALIVASSISTPAALSIKSTDTGTHRGPVALIPVNTGDPRLDKQINQFYSCIKKTGHTGGTKPEPSRDEVVGCYYNVFYGNSGGSGGTTESIGGSLPLGGTSHSGSGHTHSSVVASTGY